MRRVRSRSQTFARLPLLVGFFIIVGACGDATPSTTTAAPGTTTSLQSQPADGTTSTSIAVDDRIELLASTTPVAQEGFRVAAELSSGGAWVEVPESGVDVDVTITARDSTDEIDDGTVLTTLELGPDGAVFAEPVIVTTVFSAQELGLEEGDHALVGSLLSHADGEPMAVPTTVELTQEGDLLVRSEVTSFSVLRVFWSRRGVVRYRAHPYQPQSIWWVSQQVEIEFDLFLNGRRVDALPDGWSWEAVSPDGELAFTMVTPMVGSLRCLSLDMTRYLVALKTDVNVVPLRVQPMDCKRAIRPVSLGGTDFSVVYATCGGVHAANTNLDPAAAEAAVAALGGTFQQVSFEQGACDSHEAGWANQLSGLNADLYITGLGMQAALRGDYGGETAAGDGGTYPEPMDDGSRLFIPLEPGAPSWLFERQLTAYETWLVIHLAVQHRLGPDTGQGGIDWAQLPFLGPDPLDVEGFEAEFVRQWSMPLAG